MKTILYKTKPTKLIDNTELVKLHEFGLILNSTHNLEQILRQSAVTIQSIMEADGCHISFAKKLINELKLETAIHVGDRAFPPDADETKGLSGITFATGETVIVTDAIRDPRVTKRIQQALGHRSVVSVPIMVKGEILGVVAVYSPEPGKYTERHGEFLAMLASHLGLAVENARLLQQLRNAAFTDPLTGAYNHGYFRNELEHIISQQPDSLVSLIMLDVNDLKIINDTFGHIYGDCVLKEITQVLKQNVRSMDIVARYGGDEFAIILPGADTEEALRVAERVEVSVAKNCFLKQNFKVSVSWGAITTKCFEVGNINNFIDLADSRLYNMKRLIKQKSIAE